MSAISPKDIAGASGIFRFIRHSTKGLHGSGPDGKVEFSDLFELDSHGLPVRDAGGRIIPRHPERVSQDLEINNKWTRRGLSYLMHRAMSGHGGGPYVPIEITYGQTTVPFSAFMLLADETGPPAKPADARVTWGESDGQYDALIAKLNSVAGQGKRGILFSDTGDTYLRRISVRYPTSTPYRELEYVFYAQANSAPQEAGNLHYIDNFPIKAVCIAAGLACGYDEANSQIGIRAILGVAPTHQCVSDRKYAHEGTGLHKYLTAETVGTYGAGYVQDTDDGAGHTGDKCFDGDVAAEATAGAPNWGSYWLSADATGPHRVGRVWATQKAIRGVRIVVPAGTNSNFAPDDFQIEYLDPAKAPGGNPANLEPENATHWTLISTKTDVGITIYDTADRGLEYDFGVSKACYGIRLAALYAVSSTRKVAVAELLCYEEMTAVTISSGLANNVLRLRPAGSGLFKAFTLRNVGPTQSVVDLVTEINRQVRGYEFQAVRSDFGYLWLRGTVAGNNSIVDVDTVAAGSTANTPLGLPSGGQSKTGVTQSVTKLYDDALTITYRVAISGDHPMP